ncbi:MAG: DUF2061 domain-containing protein [Pseudomonadota bacterium]
MTAPNPQGIAEGITATPFQLGLTKPTSTAKKSPPFLGKRGALKTTTYAVMHFCVAVSVAFALTGNIKLALSIGLIEPVVQTFAYALHEFGWSRTSKEN